ALSVCLLVLAFTAVLGSGDWLLITLALVVPLLGPWLRESAIANRCKPGLRLVLSMDRLAKAIGTSSLFRVQPHWPAAGLSILAFLAVVVPSHYLPNREYPDAPAAAIDWIDSHSLPSPRPWKIFSGSNEGSYMIWRLNGRALVYTDTRGFYYPGEILEDSFYLPRQEADYDQHLQRALAHGTEYLLLPIDDAD